jgi:hypothetical protein
MPEPNIIARNVHISEYMNRADFPVLMEAGLNPLLLQGANEEPITYTELFQDFELTRNNVPFPTFKGLVVGKIVEGEQIPFISLGTGKVTVSAEDYGVRAGFTHQMIRDSEVDVMRYTTMELGKAHQRLKESVAYAALQAGAANSKAAGTAGTLKLSDIRAAKKAGALFVEEGTNIPRPVTFTHIVMHPDQVDDLIPADNTHIPPGIVVDPVTGDLKGVCGLKVIITPYMTSGVCVLVRAKDKLLFAWRERLRLDRTQNFSTAAEEVRTLEAFTFAILYGDNVYAITGC